MNSIMVIHPYRYADMWVFDDAAAGLRQEPFVAGVDTILDRLVSEIPDAASGFTLVFSASPFPGFHAEFEWRRAETGGNWYASTAMGAEGWLCPALFKYFDAAPARLYVQVRAKSSGPS